MNKNILIVEDQSHHSYSGHPFDLTSRKWKISKDNILYLSWIDDFFEKEMKQNFLKVIKYYVENYSAGHANNLSDRFREFSRYLYNAKGLISQISATDLINYKSSIDQKHEWYIIRVFLKKWLDLGYSGIQDDTKDLIDNLRIKGNIKGKAVQMLCPKSGPLSDLEFEGLFQVLVDSFEMDVIKLEDFVIMQLFMATGRRPSQLADLKVKDLIVVESENGLKEFILRIPRIKQRGVGWRQQFRTFALTQEVGSLIKSLISQNENILMEHFKDAIVKEFIEFPIFPNWKLIKSTLNDKASVINISIQDLHRPSSFFNIRIGQALSILEITSERTGERLKLFPTRLRRTLATRAAREGFGELVIAELLDHTDTQNARVYTENVPEHVDAINEAVARQLAPLAQAFTGIVIDKEINAIRGDDLNSRVKCESGGVGTCGNFGFCGALAPISCYTCKKFQPWLHGPHNDVLEALMQERERLLELTQDKTMAAINDRTILAVTQVVQICERKIKDINQEKCNE